MAGRGVDILLGGNPEYLARQEMAAREFDNDRYLMFEMDEEERAEYEAEYEPIYRRFKEGTDAEHEEGVELGGLYVLGTERHESRRIDNQLQGHSGRQGDPGLSRFYLSLEDDPLPPPASFPLRHACIRASVAVQTRSHHGRFAT